MLFSLPGATKMFQFTPFAPGIYFVFIKKLAICSAPSPLPALGRVSSSLRSELKLTPSFRRVSSSLRSELSFLKTQNRYQVTDLQSAGLPHSEIPGSKLTYSSPRLIAVRHVLHRHLVRRHPPCALCAFTIILVSLCCTLSLTNGNTLYIFKDLL